jgi:hypothetical protein
MRVTAVLTFLLTLIAAPVLAASVDIGFNDDSFELGGEWTLTTTDFGDTVGNARYLHNIDTTRLASAGIDFIGIPGTVNGLSAGIGAKAYHSLDDSSGDITNLGIGIRAEFIPPQLLGLGFETKIYYAPQIFSLRDEVRLIDSQFRITYPIIPKARVFIGYQNISLDNNDNDDGTLDNDFRIGFIGIF